MKSLQELREQRSQFAQKMRTMMDDAELEWNEETQKTYDGYAAQWDQYDRMIKAAEKQIQVDAEERVRTNEYADRYQISEDEATAARMQDQEIMRAWALGAALTDEQREHMRQRNQRAAIQNAQSVGTDSEGGFTAPDEFNTRFLTRLQEFGGVREVATTQQTDHGRTIEWALSDYTADEGEILGENADSGADLDLVFGITNIGAYKYSSKPSAVSIELLQDSALNIEQILEDALARRIARITAKHFTNGTGTGQPEGVLTASSLGATGAAGQTDSVTYDDFVELEHSVDPAYRNSGCRWMFHDQTLKVIKQLKDADGRPLWVPGLTSNAPSQILDYPYTVNQDMPQMAASATSILFGDFSRYLIRDVMVIQMMRFDDSAYAKKGQRGFLAFYRGDGKWIDASDDAMKHYANAAA